MSAFAWAWLSAWMDRARQQEEEAARRRMEEYNSPAARAARVASYRFREKVGAFIGGAIAFAIGGFIALAVLKLLLFAVFVL